MFSLKIYPVILLTILFFLNTSVQFSYAQIQIMPLGDSITKGVSGPSTDDAGYRNDLYDLLTNEGVNFNLIGQFSDGSGFDANHEGHDGLWADELLAILNPILTVNPPNLVLLHIGTNDISDFQSPESTRDEIGDIIDTISSFDSEAQIILTSLVPRTDEKDDLNSTLNRLIHELYQTKRDAGTKVFYAGTNELFKDNPDWPTDYFVGADVHPTDTGFNVMAEVLFNTVMTALSANANFEVSDNFERSAFGITWDVDPEIEIQNGDLVNTAINGAGNWEYLATYKGVRNPTRVALTWSQNANSAGISRGGLALWLDSPSKDASGYLAYISTDDNRLHLWTITNGTADADSFYMASSAPVPGPGDVFKVEISGDSQTMRFDYYVNDAAAGTISTENPGVVGERFSGILLRHNRENDVAEFLAEGYGDFSYPTQITDLGIPTFTATSALLTWTASGDDGSIGRAATYDLRYSETDILDENDFANATAISGPKPANGGAQESFPALDLLPGTITYFALKVFDEVGNASPISNVVSVTTEDGELFTDDFNRTQLGSKWQAAASIQISNDELENTSSDQTTWNLAIQTGRVNAQEVSFKWSVSADSEGVDQGGIAVMLDSPELTANGYLVTRRTLGNDIRLWKITEGQNPDEPITKTPLLAKPKPGDEFRIRISTDGSGNHFTILINGVEDATISDDTFFIDPGSFAELYCGVMLAGGRNNNVDDFKVLNSDISSSVADDNIGLPTDFILSQNYPNPFNPETKINYEVPRQSQVKIEVYNLLGQKVRNLFDSRQAVGRYSITWDGKSDFGLPISSGVYLIQMRAGNFVAVRQAVLVK